MKPSIFQENIYKEIKVGKGSIIVDSVAGSGKTTTTINSLKLIPKDKSVLSLAFNKSIADELSCRVPPHIEVMTLNGLGFRILRDNYSRRFTLLGAKTWSLINEYVPSRFVRLHGDKLSKLVTAAKVYGLAPASSRLVGPMPDNDESWSCLMDRFGIIIDEDDLQIAIEYVRGVLHAGLMEIDRIDFDDQLYLPVLLDVICPSYDYVFIDEAQDVSPVQRALLKKVLKPNGRLVAVGDSNQAIYGFRGADPESLDCMASEFDAKRLPLSVSYRCPQSVVAYASQFVDHIRPSDSAISGSVSCWSWYDGSEFNKNDLIICRNTAPILQMATLLIARGLPVNVLGRDFGIDLKKLIKRLEPSGIYGVNGLLGKLKTWKEKQIESAIKKGQSDLVESITDRAESIVAITSTVRSGGIISVIAAIDRIFTGSELNAMTLCTVHKAKGLEADRVFVLDPDLMPSKYASKPWQQRQELNLIYVAVTRAKRELVFIRRRNFIGQEIINTAIQKEAVIV